MSPLEVLTACLTDLRCALRPSDPSGVLTGAAAVFRAIASIVGAAGPETLTPMLAEIVTTPDAPWWVVLLMQFALRELASHWRSRPKPGRGEQAPPSREP
jgi:hypothetical protein